MKGMIKSLCRNGGALNLDANRERYLEGIADRSRVSREAHVRLCEGLGRKGSPSYSTSIWMQDWGICVFPLGVKTWGSVMISLLLSH